MKRLVTSGAALVIGVGYGSCGGTTPAQNARVYGVVTVCGTPMNICVADRSRRAVISVLDGNQDVIAHSRLLTGRFSFDLRPGQYTLSATIRGFVLGSVSVDAVADHATRANITNPNIL
jgi:hypothetical protein